MSQHEEIRVRIRQLEQELLDIEKNRKLLKVEEYRSEKVRIRAMLTELSNREPEKS